MRTKIAYYLTPSPDHSSGADGPAPGGGRADHRGRPHDSRVYGPLRARGPHTTPYTIHRTHQHRHQTDGSYTYSVPQNLSGAYGSRLRTYITYMHTYITYYILTFIHFSIHSYTSANTHVHEPCSSRGTKIYVSDLARGENHLVRSTRHRTTMVTSER